MWIILLKKMMDITKILLTNKYFYYFLCFIIINLMSFNYGKRVEHVKTEDALEIIKKYEDLIEEKNKKIEEFQNKKDKIVEKEIIKWKEKSVSIENKHNSI